MQHRAAQVSLEVGEQQSGVRLADQPAGIIVVPVTDELASDGHAAGEAPLILNRQYPIAARIEAHRHTEHALCGAAQPCMPHLQNNDILCGMDRCRQPPQCQNTEPQQ